MTNTTLMVFIFKTIGCSDQPRRAKIKCYDYGRDKHMSDEINDRDKVYLRVNIKGTTLERFKSIKEHLGFEHDSEVIRFLILQEYKRMFGDP